MSTDFANRLISLRGEKNLTQQQLADAVGITPSQISRYESGQAKPRRTVLFKLATALGVTVAELSPDQILQVAVGERETNDPPFKLRQRMYDELASMDGEEIQKIRADAKEAGIPFEQYITDKAEKNFIEMTKKATEAGDFATAGFYNVFARILFGTRMKLVDPSEEPDTHK
ncbi:helix-turn-helix domain-containing protein [Pseudomonas protegens]|uniref:helix-turn-helix domain-containing protein n=1 Tax=Pseudomonas protegens TaxID=380021 RepID=UPI00274C006B|nr:helix-turn-helix transcriptional regulator [Pseudomonas protegens]MDP9528493.1 helix-turn-helix transcriptional regulator [Pseudomonas protegens]